MNEKEAKSWADAHQVARLNKKEEKFCKTNLETPEGWDKTFDLIQLKKIEGNVKRGLEKIYNFQDAALAKLWENWRRAKAAVEGANSEVSEVQLALEMFPKEEEANREGVEELKGDLKEAVDSVDYFGRLLISYGRAFEISGKAIKAGLDRL